MGSISYKKIGEVAELLDTTPRALRFYEEEGLVTACRTPGGTRFYSEEDIARFKAILSLAHSGLPIGLIKQLATIRSEQSTGAESSREVGVILNRLLIQVKDQIASLTKLKSELSFAAETIKSCSNCQNPPTRTGCPQCSVNNNLQLSDLLNLIWEQHSCQDHPNKKREYLHER